MEPCAGDRRGWIEQRGLAPYIETIQSPGATAVLGVSHARRLLPWHPFYQRYLRRGLKLSPELM
jgi:hypothetical protein